jgi:hypothetical protein
MNSLVLCGCQIGGRGEGHRLRVFENTALRREFGCIRE